MKNRALGANFWNADYWEKELEDAATLTGVHCAFCMDGELMCAVLIWSHCKMHIIHRAKEEHFTETVESACPWKDSIATQGSFGDASKPGFYRKYLRDSFGEMRAVAPDYLPVMGDVIVNGSKLSISDPRPDRAFIAYGTSSHPFISMGYGNPPTDAMAAIGGLGPVILGGKAFSADMTHANYNSFYRAQNAESPRTGKSIVSLSPTNSYILIVVQPHTLTGGGSVTLDAMRDKLVSAGTRDAVFLDGSTSVMLFGPREWKIRQDEGTGSRYKDSVTSIGLRFQITNPSGKH